MQTGYPVVNDPLYNHEVFGPLKGKGGDLGGKTDEELVRDLIHIHNAENWLGMDGDSELSMFNGRKGDLDDTLVSGKSRNCDDDGDPVSREPSPCDDSSRSSPPACESIVANPLVVSYNHRRVIDAKVKLITIHLIKLSGFAQNCLCCSVMLKVTFFVTNKTIFKSTLC